MKYAFVIGFLLLFGASVRAQGVPNGASITCQNLTGCVLLTKEAAQTAIVNVGKVEALETEVKRLGVAINGSDDPNDPVRGYKQQIADWREKYAAIAGEYSGYKQGRVVVDAIIPTLVAKPTKSCKPLSFCLF